MYSLKWLCTAGVFAAALLSGCSSSNSSSGTPAIVTPTILWTAPAPVNVGTALSATQLDATAVIPGTSVTVPGTFTYTPGFGTVENTAGSVTLSAAFTPYSPQTYAAATGTVSLTVLQPTRQTPVITWATPASVPYGTALSATQLDATVTAPGSTTALAGTLTYTPALGTVETAGTQTLSVSFTPTDTIDYNSASATVPLVVTQVAPTLTWAAPAAVSIDTYLNASQLNATTTVPGTFTYTPALGSEVTSAGNQTLSVSFTPTDAKDYSTATASVTLPVDSPTYAFTPVRIIGGGYVDRIVMHPGQQGLMYAGTDVGGAYRWDNKNSIWIPLTDFVTRANAFQIGIESIGIDPSDVQRLYLSAGEYTESYGTDCVLYSSDDQGTSFTTLTMPFKCGSNDNGRGAGERLSVDPNLGSNILWGTRQNGLYQSTNHGTSWAQVSNFPVTGATSGAGIVFEAYIPTSSSTGSATKTIYVGVSATGTGTDPQSLYVTNDGGTTWKPVPGAPTGFYLSHGVLGPDGNLYFSAGDQIGPGGVNTGAIYQYILPSSANPNGTWNNITPPRTSSTQGGYAAVTLDPEKPGTLVASTLDHYYPIGDDLWRSLDYGKTWVSIDTVGIHLDDSLSPYLLFGAGSTAGFGTGNWPTGLAIDPFNSDHLVYGTGATVETTSNLTASDTGQTTNFTVGALGIEETVILGLISPPSGPANLLSVMGDVNGFEHTDLTVSPAQGMFQSPSESTSTSIDFAQAAPATIVRVGNGNGSNQFGGYSTTSGAAWKPFPTNPTGVTGGGGSVAIATDASTIVWSPGDSGSVTSYSKDNGATWTASAGAINNTNVYSDRVNPKKFYLYNASAGTILTSIDGGATFTQTITGAPNYGSLYVGYDAEGSLYIANYGGLYHAALNATTFTPYTGVQSAYQVTQGIPATGSTFNTLYIAGTIGGNAGLYRSTDNGANWVRFDGVQNQYGGFNAITGDQRIFGRVYLGTGGRGIVYADSTF